MQRLASSRRFLQSALAPGRAHSSLSAAAVAAAPENGLAGPKMPPFDYTPPPYDGPRVADIARKRAEFLSPSLFHFYDRPVRVPPRPLPPPIFLERTRLTGKK
jgi:alanine-glyoxylate transaminase/(R)-3-amino-2-methylpropionate-pyruvate transaminase